jgi:hypothetical protein
VQERYKDLYYELGLDDNDLAKPTEKDFHEPLQLAEESSMPACSSGACMMVISELKGESTDPCLEVAITNRVDINMSIEPLSIDKPSPIISTMPGTQISASQTFGFNPRSHRRLAKDVYRTTYAIHQGNRDKPPLIELTKVMAWPPVVNCTGNPRVFLAVPAPVPMAGFTREPAGFPVETSPRSSKTVKY